MISIINAEWVLYTVFEDLHDYKCAGERAIICVSRSLPGDKCCSSVLFSSESSVIRKISLFRCPLFDIDLVPG